MVNVRERYFERIVGFATRGRVPMVSWRDFHRVVGFYMSCVLHFHWLSKINSNWLKHFYAVNRNVT